MSIVHIPRADGRVSGFPIPANRFDGQNLGLAVVLDSRIPDFQSTVSALRRAASAAGTPIIGHREMSNGDHVFGLRMPSDPAQLFIQIGMRRDDVRTTMNTLDTRDRGAVLSRFEAAARHYDEAGEGLFAPRELTWNIRGRAITERMFGRTIEGPSGPIADFGRHMDGRRNDYGDRAALFGKANTPSDWSVIARSVVARVDRDRIAKVGARDLDALYLAALGGRVEVTRDEFRELIEQEITGALASRNAQGRETAQRMSTALPEHSERGGTRLVLAQFSTPPAVSQVAAEFLKPNGKVILEPTIGNGVLASVSAQYGGLVIGVDIDENRAARAQAALNRGVGSIVSVGDAFDAETYPQNPVDERGFDAALINPPYKKLANGDDEPTKRQVRMASLGIDVTVSSAELLVAAQAIDKVKPGGSAVLVMPGNMYDPAKIEPKQRNTHNVLNMAFEKVDAVALDPNLYRSMGANFPVIVYFCEGKREDGKTPELGKLPDMLPSAYPVMAGFSDFYAAADRIIAASAIEVLPEEQIEENFAAFGAARLAVSGQLAGPGAVADAAPIPAPPKPSPVPPTPSPASEGSGDAVPEGERSPTGGSGAPGVSGTGGSGAGGSRGSSGSSRGSGGQGRGQGGEATPRPVPGPDEEPSPEPPVGFTPEPSEEREEEGELALPSNYHVLDNFNDDPFTVAYSPFSAKGAGNIVIERSLESATYSALRQVVSQHGDIDRYVAGKLGMDVEFLLSEDGPLSGTQIDAMALSFHNREDKRATIIGDLMGVGKGRQMAAHAWNALIEGRAVLMMSNKPHLFRDLAIRDLKEVSGKSFKTLLDEGVVNPFIMNATDEAALTEKDGKTIVFQTLAAERNAVKQKGRVNLEYNFVMSSYSQFQIAAGVWKADAILEWIKAHAANDPDRAPVLLLDEVHEAAGPDSRTGVVMRRVLEEAERVGAEIVFSSATSMKSGKNIGVYRQALPDTGLSLDQLTEIIESNPFAMQEVLSTEMARSGSLIQRKLPSVARRDMRLLADVDAKKLDEDRQMTDELAGFLRESVSMGAKIREAAIQQAKYRFGGLANAASTLNKLQVDTVSPAASFDAISRYYLISIKGRYAKDLLRELYAAGEKATVLQEFTGDSVAEYVMETAGYGSANHLPKEGWVVPEHPHIGHVVKRMAERMLDVKGTDALGNAITFRIAGFDHWLKDFMDRIDDADFSRWRVNTFDVVKEACDELGLTFEDISGRKYEFDKVEGQVIVRPREIPHKMAVANRFNNGLTDCLMLTSAAATGMSLQNSPYEGVDLRTRAMLFLSFLKNIASHTQAEGRIDRTAQLTPPHYVIPNSGFVADDRLASLFNRGNRNLSSMTSGSRENDRMIREAVDLLNPIGDLAVREVLERNPEIAETLGIAVDKDGKIEAGDLGRKLLGRAFILGAEESQEVLADVDLAARTIMQDLDAQGENPLKLGRYDWKAEFNVIEALHDGDENSLSLADQPLNLVEMVRLEPRKVISAKAMIEQVRQSMEKGGTDFETIAEKFDTASVLKPYHTPDQGGAWRFEHRLFDRLAGRSLSETGLGNDAAFEKETPLEVFDAIHTAYVQEKYLFDKEKKDETGFGFERLREICERAAEKFSIKYVLRDDDGRVDTVRLASRLQYAADREKPILNFFNAADAKGKPELETINMERAFRSTIRRVEQVRGLLDFAELVEPGRMVALNIDALDAISAGRMGELFRNSDVDPKLTKWVPGVILSANYDEVNPTALSRNSFRVFVPGEGVINGLSFSELKSNLSFRQDPDGQPLAPFRTFASQIVTLSRGEDECADLLKEVFGEKALQFVNLMIDYTNKHYRSKAAEEADASRIVDWKGQVQAEGSKLFREMADCLPRGEVQRKRYGLTGNLFTAMSAVTSTGREKNLGEKAVVTDRHGNNVNVILLNERGQKQAVERVREREKARSHPRIGLRGSIEKIRAEIALTALVMTMGRQNQYGSIELTDHQIRSLQLSMKALYPKTFGTEDGQEYLRKNGAEFLAKAMEKLESDKTYPVSLLVGGDLWRSAAEEQAREVRKSGSKAPVISPPVHYHVSRRPAHGDLVPTHIGEDISNLRTIRSLGGIDDRQAVLLFQTECARLVFRKSHQLAQGGEFKDLVGQAVDTLSFDNSKAVKMGRGVMALTFGYGDARTMERVAEFMTRASALGESAVLSGGFGRNVHAAIDAEHQTLAREMARARMEAAENAKRPGPIPRLALEGQETDSPSVSQDQDLDRDARSSVPLDAGPEFG